MLTFYKSVGPILIVLILFPVCSASAEKLQEMTVRYKNLRYDEDYSYLRDPTKRSDPFDAIKYIPLRKDMEGWYVSLGGEAKARFEGWRNPDWGEAGREDKYLLQRYMAHIDVHLGSRMRTFVQFRRAFKGGGSPPDAIDQDDPDLQQAFVDVRLLQKGKNSLIVRLGRQELLYGSTRLVSVREGSNIRRSFDGLKTMLTIKSWSVHSWITRPVDIRKGVFNDRSAPDRAFWGIYVVPGGSRDRTGIDLYYLGIRKDAATYNQGRADEVRHTIGVRPWGLAGNWDYDLELSYQLGNFGQGEITAWMAATNSGYTFRSHRFKPRLGLKIEVASGDKDAKSRRLQTFNPMFYNSLLFNETDLVGLSNLIDVHPYFSFWPGKRVWWSFDWAFFWRQSRHDAVYDNVLQIQRRPPEDSSRVTGNALSTFIRWHITPHITGYGAYTHFFAGPFINETGSGKNVDFLGLWGVFKF